MLQHQTSAFVFVAYVNSQQECVCIRLSRSHSLWLSSSESRRNKELPLFKHPTSATHFNQEAFKGQGVQRGELLSTATTPSAHPPNITQDRLTSLVVV